MRKLSCACLVALIVAALAGPTIGADRKRARGARTTYVVLYRAGASLAAARDAVADAGGRVVRENRAVGVATVVTRNPRFVAAVRREPALAGAARNRRIGRAPNDSSKVDDIDRVDRAQASGRGRPSKNGGPQSGEDPLFDLQWNMHMINATPEGSYARQAGDRRVLVGVIDTGIDGSHPDIAPNFSTGLSRNFTTDIPSVDGPCAQDPDALCTDPANVDENGHGTHVSGIVAAALNGRGVSGVAPNVSLVNLRAGQDSGYFFLQATVDALTFAGDNGLDVVNMSYFVDPWLYNCRDNPADSPAAQLEQRTIIAATNRALDYARKRGVTLVAALGNDSTDLGNPTIDVISPDFPPDAAYERQVDNSCLNLPTEGNNVVAVSGLGPSERKAWYSNWGVEQTTVAAPGGDSFDAVLPAPQHRVLSSYPLIAILQEEKEFEVDLIDDNGEPLTDRIIRECLGASCAYYRYLQGTSMAAPHATGVVALIVSEYGRKDGKHKGGLAFHPHQSERILVNSARDHACPPGGVQAYPEIEPFEEILGPWENYTARCEGGTSFNGFYGHGIIDAWAAVSSKGHSGKHARK